MAKVLKKEEDIFIVIHFYVYINVKARQSCYANLAHLQP